MKRLLLLFISITCVLTVNSQSSADAAVQLSASAQASPAQITLHWIANSSSNQYVVYRKLKSAVSWGAALTTLSGSSNQYVDNAVSPGISYEYRVVRNGSNYTGYGYINTGIQVPEIEWRGKLILLVDSTFVTSLSNEISRLIKDIEGDGWDVIRHDVDRNGSVYHVKSLIESDFVTDSFKIKSVFILGHVPVPYSGNINPDGHSDHLGAWPADCYYGDVDGIWTDNFISSTTASPLRTQNVPGDGKFDQSIVPSDIEFQVGRVDFNNMPSFTSSELQLLKNYLDKDHEYRHKIYQPIKQAVVDDNFGFFSSEAFAASGFKTFAPLLGPANVTVGDYFTSMNATSYQWSYGCGGGTYTSASGIGNTGNFSTANLQGVFTMLFGSYFGDWDSQDNFLKAPLAQGKVLSSIWSGRPHYQFHHMAMGENIGYDVLLTQNNPGNLYYASPTSITGRWVHNALMGDPTLRQDIVAPVSNVIATRIGNNCHISWSASTESNLLGYNVYVKNDSVKSYIKLNNALITGTTFTDNCLAYAGVYSYLVRTVKLETNPSGSYYNLSTGIADTAFNTNNYASIAGFSINITGNVVHYANTSSVPGTYYWDFGNGTSGTTANPVVTYTANGLYQTMLIGNSLCYSDTSNILFNITQVGLSLQHTESDFRVMPNPSDGKIRLEFEILTKADVRIMNTEGRLVFSKENVSSGEELDLGELRKGLYYIELKTNDKRMLRKLTLN